MTVTYEHVTERWSRFPWDGWGCDDEAHGDDDHDCKPPVVTRPVAHNGDCGIIGAPAVDWQRVGDEAHGHISYCHDCEMSADDDANIEQEEDEAP